MIRAQLSQAAAWAKGVHQGADATFQGVSTDSRNLEPGQLFVALRGDQFDGHEFVAQVAAAGAAAALVEYPCEVDLPQVVASNSRTAFGGLASGWRQTLSLPVVGITGSNGKTTVKEMIAAILRVHGQVLATRGNLNNDIGVPLTLCQLDPSHSHAVIEMGANHGGEIAGLCDLAKPQIGVVTNAGRAHLAGFGSIEGVARAKGEMFSHLPANGIGVVNADERYAQFWIGLLGDRAHIDFGTTAAAHVRTDLESIEVGVSGGSVSTHFELIVPHGECAIALPLAGRHNVYNALAASAAAVALGVELADIRQGLESMKPVAGRLAVSATAEGGLVIDDTYNANPDSLAAALDVLKLCPGERWLVLGDMAELGVDGGELHAGMGDLARRAGIDRLWSLGELAAGAAGAFARGGRTFDRLEDLLEALREQLPADASVLVKGSRRMRMERVVASLLSGQQAEVH